MENFFYEDKFYSDLGELMHELEYYEQEDIDKLPDDFILNCKDSFLEPVITLSADWICERINEERFTEEGEEVDRIEKILKENIDFEKVNSLMPKLYYEGRNKFKVTKQDLINWIK